MRIISVNVGLPRTIAWKGTLVSTAIFKEPVNERLRLRRLNFDGDRQADLRVHGGKDKAVYVYPSEHYAFWRKELPGVELPWGMFGENLTIEGLLENDAFIGDSLRIGTAELVVTQPRMPCYKLGLKFGNDDMIRRFHESRRSGFYLAVNKEGDVGAGDEIRFLARDARRVSIADFYRVFATHAADEGLLQRMLENPALPDSWRPHFEEMLSMHLGV